MDFTEKLRQNIFFALHYQVYNFVGMGQLAVEITYTDDSTDMLTTKSINTNVHSTFDFNSDEEYFQFIKFLETNNVKKL
jgi:hypothetical protein